MLHVSGCLCFPYLHPYLRHKLEPWSHASVFLGYPSHYQEYRCLDPISSRVFITPQVVFDEHSFPFWSTASVIASNGKPLSKPVETTNVSSSSPLPLPCSTTISSIALTTITTENATSGVPSQSTTSMDPIQEASVGRADISSTHSMVTHSRAGTLPPSCFTISKHHTAFSVSAALYEPKTFANARKQP